MATKAVHFDGVTLLTNSSPVGPQSNKLTASGWCRPQYVRNPPFYENSLIALFRSVNPNYPLGTAVAGGYDGGADMFFYAQDDSTENWLELTRTSGALLVDKMWLNVLFSADLNAGVVQCYLNDVAVTLGSGAADGSSSFNMDLMGHSVCIPDVMWTPESDSGKAVGTGQLPPVQDMADLWIDVGMAIDFSVQANRRRFINATLKPVDLGTNGELPTGSRPTFFFSGDAGKFAVNKGTGGPFVVTGSLTNASSSPDD